MTFAFGAQNLTRTLAYAKSEYKIHDLENVGDADLWFTTVEFLDSANAVLELGRGRHGEACSTSN
ncbi:hypothetical protein [Bradyrhizobium sp. USDA 3315]